MPKFHIIIFSIVLAILASTSIGTNLKNKNQDHLRSQGFLCPDREWVTALPGQETPTYTVKWCYSGSGCFEENDFVYVSVKSREAYIQCRAETSKILQFAFGLATSIAGVVTAGGWAQAAMAALKAGIKTGVKMGKEQIKGSGGGDGCYCFAERWTSVEAIYATVISDDGRSITVEVPNDFLTQVNSENVNQYALLNIQDNSCTDRWRSSLCQQYNYIRTRKRMSWSDLADELAWLGDGKAKPGNLYMWNRGTPPAQCPGPYRKTGTISRQWCFNNASPGCDDDIITFKYTGTADIRCKSYTSLEIPAVGTMISQAYGTKVDKQTSNCICYPTNFDSTPAKIKVSDESGDFVNLDILTDQFWGLDLDTIQSQVKAKTRSASMGNWAKNILKYQGAQAKYKYDWDEFGDDFAWWGDRNSKTDGLNKLTSYKCAEPTFADFAVSRDLTAGTCLYSDSDPIRQTDRTQLNMQSDGHLCVYQRSSASAPWVYKWGSLTAGQGVGPYRACMQKDGNFVLYDSNNNPLWHTHTNTNPDCTILKVQTDGNVVLYQSKAENQVPAWYTSTMI